MKKILLTILLIFSMIFVNGCYYVFHGQFKSQMKLDDGKELSLYECCSIYTMHLAVWMLGWPLAPEAASECARLHWAQPEEVYPRSLHTGYNLLSPKVLKAFRQLEHMPDGSRIRVTWNGVKDYALGSVEHRAAIAVNPCYVVKDTRRFDDENLVYFLESEMLYPVKSVTPFNLGKFTIILNEGLFRYLQDKGWLSKYTMIYPFGEAMFTCKETEKGWN